MTTPLDRLRALHAAATPGPWMRLHDAPSTVESDDVGERDADGIAEFLAKPQDKTCNCAQVWSRAADCAVAYCAVGPYDAPSKEHQMRNAASIAANHSALPALLACVDALRSVAPDHPALAPLLEAQP